jgi:hypothetical protein
MIEPAPGVKLRRGGRAGGGALDWRGVDDVDDAVLFFFRCLACNKS